MQRSAKYGTEIAIIMVMKRMICHILFAASLLLTFAADLPARVPSPQEEMLMALINEARRSPLAIAASVGRDPDQVLRELPHLRGILNKGLPPLVFSSEIYGAAAGHAEDLLERDYYSSRTPEGAEPEDRMMDAGYLPRAAGETIGMIGFGNLLDPEDAVRALFENMYKDELNPGRTKPRNILNPVYEDAAVGLRSGILVTEGVQRNVYVAVADFGADIDSRVEAALLRRINEARRDPAQAAAGIGMEADDAYTALGNYGWIIDGWLPPVAWDETLHETALAHAHDMIGRRYYGSHTPEGKGPALRIAETGYKAEYAVEALAGLVVDGFTVDPVLIADVLFDLILREAFRPGRNRGLFDPEATAAGIGFNAAVIDMGNGASVKAYVAVADFARPVDGQPILSGNLYAADRDCIESISVGGGSDYRVVGGIFDDLPLDADRGFAFEKAALGMRVRLSSWSEGEWVPVAERMVGSYGFYQMPMPEGILQVAVIDQKGAEVALWMLPGQGQNYLKDFPLCIGGESL